MITKSSSRDILFFLRIKYKSYNKKKKKKKSSFASNKVFIRWWSWVQAWFRGRSIITTNPGCPSYTSQYYQILLDGVWSVRMPYPFRCCYSLSFWGKILSSPLHFRPVIMAGCALFTNEFAESRSIWNSRACFTSFKFLNKWLCW